MEVVCLIDEIAGSNAARVSSEYVKLATGPFYEVVRVIGR
jgi:hypothetical protein